MDIIYADTTGLTVSALPVFKIILKHMTSIILVQYVQSMKLNPKLDIELIDAIEDAPLLIPLALIFSIIRRLR